MIVYVCMNYITVPINSNKCPVSTSAPCANFCKNLLSITYKHKRKTEMTIIKLINFYSEIFSLLKYIPRLYINLKNGEKVIC